MPRNRGQHPPYGEIFRLESTEPPAGAGEPGVRPESRTRTGFVRSDKTSKVRAIYRGASRDTATAMGCPLPSLTAAMAKLLDGIRQGFYQTASTD